MLIKWAANDDIPAWRALAGDVAYVFGDAAMATDAKFNEYMESKISKFEALIAVDRASGDCLGVIGFSRTYNRISWFGVFERHRGKGIGKRLLATALRQLDNTKEISVITFREDDALGQPARAVYRKLGFVDADNTVSDNAGNLRCKMVLAPTHEKRGGSFHYKYLEYDKYAKAENCLCGKNPPAAEGEIDIELEHSVVCLERAAQGRLFGKCYVIIKNHHADFEYIPFDEMAGFMSDVQKAGKALHKVTRAIKINYEIHANTAPHIHCHLFPRYLDDDFPSAPIDYRITEPSPYESDAEFNWFAERMREELCAV